jgi:hypothetical protein
MQVNITPPEKSVPAPEKPKWERVLPSYRALHQLKPALPAPVAEKPAPVPEKTTLGDVSLAEAMLLPYYWSLYQLEQEKPVPGAKEPAVKSPKTTVEAKKAVEAVMFPLYQTLNRAEPNKPLSPVEKKYEGKAPPTLLDLAMAHPPGCARQRHPLKSF